MSLGTMGKSYLGSLTTTSVLGSRRKQACFVDVTTAVTGSSHCDRRFQHRHGKRNLTSVSTPELVFSDQKVGSLVIIPESPDVGPALPVRKSSPTTLGRPHPIGSSLTQLISPYPASSPSHSTMSPMTWGSANRSARYALCFSSGPLSPHPMFTLSEFCHLW